jgi:hypothetical protein
LFLPDNLQQIVYCKTYFEREHLTFKYQSNMWSKTYSKIVREIKAEEIWKVWSDINQWRVWQDDIEYAKLNGKFEAGNKFILKPKNASAVTIKLVEVETNKYFIDLTCFPLAKMYGKHEFISLGEGDELEIKTTISVTGFLSFVWRKLVAEKIAADEAIQTEQLIKRVIALRI